MILERIKMNRGKRKNHQNEPYYHFYIYLSFSPNDQLLLYSNYLIEVRVCGTEDLTSTNYDHPKENQKSKNKFIKDFITFRKTSFNLTKALVM